MRIVSAIVLGLVMALPAVAQTPKPAPPTASPSRTAAPADAIAKSYAAIALADRIAIQADLIWTGDYNGLTSGEFGERAVAAVKAFQKGVGAKETGVLNPQERAALAAAAKAKREAVGWNIVDDPASRTRLGLPVKLVPQAAPGKTGSRYSSAKGEVVIETFRIAEAGTTLQAVFEKEKKEPAGRKSDYSVLRGDFFVVSGLQGLKKFYVRAQAGGGEVRGVTILYDQAMEGIMDPVTVAMSSAFTAFPAGAAAVPPPKRKVEYATGIVVSPGGYVITERQATDGCYVITVEGLGSADRVAEDKASELALLRLFGVRDLVPAAFAEQEPKGIEATLVGVPDPQSQAGGGAVATAKARLGPPDATRALEPAPGLGFSGGAVLDGDGRLVGMVALKTPVVAGLAPAGPAAVMMPGAAIREFLEKQKVPLAGTGSSGVEAAKSSVARVICARK